MTKDNPVAEGLNAVASIATAPSKNRAGVTEAVLDAGTRLDEAQARVNELEAASSSLFVSGWRPAVGWVCVFALTYSFLMHPFLVWFCLLLDIPKPPDIDVNMLYPLLMGILGLGAARSWEKAQGITQDILYTPKQRAKAERYRAKTKNKYE